MRNLYQAAQLDIGEPMIKYLTYFQYDIELSGLYRNVQPDPFPNLLDSPSDCGCAP
jgi:hypothetical protein